MTVDSTTLSIIQIAIGIFFVGVYLLFRQLGQKAYLPLVVGTVILVGGFYTFFLNYGTMTKFSVQRVRGATNIITFSIENYPKP